MDDKNKLKASSEKDLLGMNMKEMSLIGADSLLRRHISKHLDKMKEDAAKPENQEKMLIMTKQDQFRYELHMRLAVAMLALANAMKPEEGEQFSPLSSQFI